MTPSPLSSQAKSRALRYNGDGNTYYNRWKLQHLKGVDIVLQPSIAATFKPYFRTFSSVCQAMEKNIKNTLKASYVFDFIEDYM